MLSWASLGFQDFSSFAIIELNSFHDYVIVVMASVVGVISYIMIFLVLNKASHKYLVEGGVIETIWSVVPAFLLLVLVVPSMKVLYLIEDTLFPNSSVKIIGHQWYWSYVIPILGSVCFKFKDSFVDYLEYDTIIDSYSIGSENPRLLGSRNYLLLPINTSYRLLISSTDVIHSFAVPSLGLKVDALPGRINQLLVSPCRLGFYFGQCSEICGSNHSFMPVVLKVVSTEDFVSRESLILTEELVKVSQDSS